MKQPLKEELFQNRLNFITHHRSQRVQKPGLEIFHSPNDFLKNVFLLDASQLKHTPKTHQLHLPDWVKIDNKTLSEAGWQYTETMRYMYLTSTPDWPYNDAVRILKAETREEIDLFCQVQAMGFGGGSLENNEWYPFMLKSALKNYGDQSHQFYLAKVNDKAVGVTLGFYHQEWLGIYSVATLTSHRRQGISTSLMKQVVEDGIAASFTKITLQVTAGSLAEDIYRKLGFKPLFDCKMYDHNKK